MSIRQQLNSYSQRFAERLFAEHPDWECRAQIEPWATSDPGSFLVEVPSPSAGRVLSVGTDGGEVTVALGPEWHGHYGGWTGADEATSFAEALANIAGILADRLVVAVGFREGRPGMSTLLPAGEPAWFDVDGVERVDYCSWSGIHDRSVPA